VLCSPNFGYKHYLKAFSDDKAAGLDLSAVRLVFNGAEPISAALCEEFLRTMAPYGLAPDVMFPVYGLAEASLAVAFPPPGRPLRTIALDRFALGTGNLARPIPADAPGAVVLVLVGQPIRDCSVRIAGEDGAPVTDGTIGRILIRGNNVTSGYYRDPVTTDATRSADGWLDTGDLGVVVDGELAITGRVKEILFVAGQNLYPHDIEAVIDKHAGVELGRAAVAGVRPAEAATDDVIVFVITKGQLADFVAIAREIRRVVNEHMAIAVAAVVPVTRLPKTTSGKIQRYALARDYEAGAFAEVLRELAELEGTTAKGDDDVGGTDIERTLLEICRAMLPAKHVGLDDNIFELGTSSLTLAQIYERVEAEYPGQLEVTDFFEFPTVRAMAGFLTRRMRGEA
jgi:acyl-CoA synthetase (AMP-forming)/AMP-acid ligase II